MELDPDLTPFLNELENMPFDEVHNKGLFLHSTTNISAYYEVGQTLNTDIFALKGANALGTSLPPPLPILCQQQLRRFAIGI